MQLQQVALLCIFLLESVNSTFWFRNDFDRELEAGRRAYKNSISPYLRALAIYKRKLQMLDFFPIVTENGYSYASEPMDPYDIADDYDEYMYYLLNAPSKPKRYRNGYKPKTVKSKPKKTKTTTSIPPITSPWSIIMPTIAPPKHQPIYEVPTTSSPPIVPTSHQQAKYEVTTQPIPPFNPWSIAVSTVSTPKPQLMYEVTTAIPDKQNAYIPTINYYGQQQVAIESYLGLPTENRFPTTTSDYWFNTNPKLSTTTEYEIFPQENHLNSTSDEITIVPNELWTESSDEHDNEIVTKIGVEETSTFIPHIHEIVGPYFKKAKLEEDGIQETWTEANSISDPASSAELLSTASMSAQQKFKDDSGRILSALEHPNISTANPITEHHQSSYTQTSYLSTEYTTDPDLSDAEQIGVDIVNKFTTQSGKLIDKELYTVVVKAGNDGIILPEREYQEITTASSFDWLNTTDSAPLVPSVDVNVKPTYSTNITTDLNDDDEIIKFPEEIPVTFTESTVKHLPPAVIEPTINTPEDDIIPNTIPTTEPAYYTAEICQTTAPALLETTEQPMTFLDIQTIEQLQTNASSLYSTKHNEPVKDLGIWTDTTTPTYNTHTDDITNNGYTTVQQDVTELQIPTTTSKYEWEIDPKLDALGRKLIDSRINYVVDNVRNQIANPALPIRRSDILIEDDDYYLTHDDEIQIKPDIAENNEIPANTSAFPRKSIEQIVAEFNETEMIPLIPIIIKEMRRNRVTLQEQTILEQVFGEEFWKLILDEVHRDPSAAVPKEEVNATLMAIIQQNIKNAEKMNELGSNRVKRSPTTGRLRRRRMRERALYLAELRAARRRRRRRPFRPIYYDEYY